MTKNLFLVAKNKNGDSGISQIQHGHDTEDFEGGKDEEDPPLAGEEPSNNIQDIDFTESEIKKLQSKKTLLKQNLARNVDGYDALRQNLTEKN